MTWLVLAHLVDVGDFVTLIYLATVDVYHYLIHLAQVGDLTIIDTLIRTGDFLLLIHYGNRLTHLYWPAHVVRLTLQDGLTWYGRVS